MQFTPASFWIGESGIWFYSLMWEHGRHAEPVEFLDDRGTVKWALHHETAVHFACYCGGVSREDGAAAAASRERRDTIAFSSSNESALFLFR